MGIWPKVSDSAKGRDNNFNMLRMLAATGVLVSHSIPVTRGPDAPQIFEKALMGITLGDACVLMFFAVSGFFIAQSFDRSRTLASFVAKRILRIFPALFFMLIATILVAGLWVTWTKDVSYWPAALQYFISNFVLFFAEPDLPGLFVGHPFGPIVNSSLWTLSYEVLCYAWVMLCGILGLLSGPRVFGTVLVLFATALGIKFAMDLGTRIETLIYLGLPFVLGMTLYAWRTYIPLSIWIALALIAATFAVHESALFLPIMIAALSYASFLFGYANVPSLKRYNRLGDYSYGMYIYAFPIQQTGVALGFADPLSNIAFAFPVTLICAVASWHMIEKPALGLKRRVTKAEPA